MLAMKPSHTTAFWAVWCAAIERTTSSLESAV